MTTKAAVYILSACFLFYFLVQVALDHPNRDGVLQTVNLVLRLVLALAVLVLYLRRGDAKARPNPSSAGAQTPYQRSPLLGIVIFLAIMGALVVVVVPLLVKHN